jgi:hypothetical protein
VVLPLLLLLLLLRGWHKRPACMLLVCCGQCITVLDMSPSCLLTNDACVSAGMQTFGICACRASSRASSRNTYAAYC